MIFKIKHYTQSQYIKKKIMTLLWWGDKGSTLILTLYFLTLACLHPFSVLHFRFLSFLPPTGLHGTRRIQYPTANPQHTGVRQPGPWGGWGLSLVSCGLRVMREGAWRKDLGKEVKDEHWSPLLGSPVQHRVFEARLIEKPHIENRWVRGQWAGRL